MNVRDLITRRNRILAAIIQSYIDTAEPVASLTVCRRERTGLSSATIRNVMAELEKMDLIWQPHPSAGRIPTEKGYRYYVNSLMQTRELNQDEKEEVESTYRDHREQLEVIIEKTSRLLSSVTRYVGVILLPSLKVSTFKELKLVPLEGRKILVVLVTSSGLIRSSLFEAEEEISPAELAKISRFINSEFSGLSFSRMQERLRPRLTAENDPFFYLRKQACRILERSRLLSRNEEIFLEGTSYIAEQPEFKELSRLKKVLKALEDKGQLRLLLTRDLELPGVKIRIGGENRSKMMEDCTVVTASYCTRQRALGSLGVIGPMRMTYSQVVSLVNYVARTLTNFIST